MHGLSLAPDHVPDLYSRLAPFAGATSTIADINDAAAVRAAVAAARPTLVLHMAAQPLVRRSYAEPLLTFATNVTGTAQLLEALRSAPDLKAVLVVTTDKVYRNDGSGRRFVESDPLGGHDPYSASKAGTELVAAAFADSYFSKAGVALATARGGNVVGGGDWSADRLVPDVWRALHAGTPLELRYPQATRPWQHVLDCLSGYLTFLHALATRPGLPRALNFGPAVDDAPVTVAAGGGHCGSSAGQPRAAGWRRRAIIPPKRRRWRSMRRLRWRRWAGSRGSMPAKPCSGAPTGIAVTMPETRRARSALPNLLPGRPVHEVQSDRHRRRLHHRSGAGT